ncbi:2-succinyl-6-hydroxy-2,4-cyclohexadiene-1-carboxylate synthase [Piscibacillus salipiscarius]|uniref:Putative 2-succinyl-6-hydroxy-2,4-cyclohexadiene-1-carboxylate synthase n=1 Tax=Piscibacillus salipiscarius TaxID=299480 RepID=A0ABW5QCU9_9BACI|nr:2-succinyl-6-hydroxy-2,4-cyclohexadiene-1-carboxylate synthase [Piscibacillus salipiscarius]
MIITISENQYHVDIHGEGEPVVLLHGFTGSTNTWLKTTNQLKDHYQCIVIDLPGHGQTRAKVTSMEQACEDIAEVLTELKVETFHLLGYSMGGRTALVFTSMFQDRVEKLILESASPGLEGKARVDRQEQDNRLANFIETKGIEEFVDYWETIPLFKSQEKLAEAEQASIRKERLSQNPSGLTMSLRTMGTGMQPNMWPKLNDIQVPTLLITGELDEKFFDINQKVVKALPDAIHEVIPDVGHAPHLENSSFFGKIVLNYL